MMLQKHIIKVLKEETKMSNIQKKILDFVDDYGLYDTIKMTGGYEVFNDILPDYI
jgi:predicted PilT family ATPase